MNCSLAEKYRIIRDKISHEDNVVLFRGKSCKTNNWVYGLPYIDYANKSTHITYEIDYSEVGPTTVNEEVRHDTLTQYTGVNDYNGNMIFAGDIIEVPNSCFRRGGLYQVWFFVGQWCATTLMFPKKENGSKHSVYCLLEDGASLVGDIFDEKFMDKIG